VKDAVKRVPGVGDVFIFGERKYAMRLWLDPGRMAQRGLSATNVLAALQEQNVQVAAGQVGQAPLPAGPFCDSDEGTLIVPWDRQGRARAAIDKSWLPPRGGSQLPFDRRVSSD